ncbi:alpha/beta fold hydrolase [Kitasatospora sp. NPDC052896]|uniref:alpha/beta fold hydrolase n=1 Tax=Kitasatospora sp. NPDC052896 TaxID=3364061 RepID=UPI0037CA0743
MPALPLPHTLIGHGAHHVIAVHGWFGDRTSYERLLPDLDLDSFSYAFVDLRGYGEAKDTSGSYTTREAGADVVALANALGWERYSLIGHSMGACVVQRVLAAVPERVRRLVGLNPVPAGGFPMPPEQWELFSGAAEIPRNRRAIIDHTTGGVRPAAWLDRMVAQSLERSDAKAFRAWLDSWAGEDFHEEIEGSPLPVRVVVGALDPALNADVMRGTWLRWYPHADLVELPAAGHYPVEETPLQLIAAVEDFLRADDAGERSA